MSKYAYQIKGALENAEGLFCGFRVLLCTSHSFELVDVPAEIFDKEIRAFIRYRILVSEKFDIRKLPYPVEVKIRVPIGHWLDQWVLKNIYGNISKPKSLNS